MILVVFPDVDYVCHEIRVFLDIGYSSGECGGGGDGVKVEGHNVGSGCGCSWLRLTCGGSGTFFGYFSCCWHCYCYCHFFTAAAVLKFTSHRAAPAFY